MGVWAVSDWVVREASLRGDFWEPAMGRCGEKHSHRRNTKNLTLQEPLDNVSSCLTDSPVKAEILADLLIVVLVCFGPCRPSIPQNSAHMAHRSIHNNRVWNKWVLYLNTVQNTGTQFLWVGTTQPHVARLFQGVHHLLSAIFEL